MGNSSHLSWLPHTRYCFKMTEICDEKKHFNKRLYLKSKLQIFWLFFFGGVLLKRCKFVIQSNLSKMIKQNCQMKATVRARQPFHGDASMPKNCSENSKQTVIQNHKHSPWDNYLLKTFSQLVIDQIRRKQSWLYRMTIKFILFVNKYVWCRCHDKTSFLAQVYLRKTPFPKMCIKGSEKHRGRSQLVQDIYWCQSWIYISLNYNYIKLSFSNMFLIVLRCNQFKIGLQKVSFYDGAR